MNREIKFMAWHKVRKELYKVHGWHSEFVFKDTLDGVGVSGNPDKLEDVILLQFTGLYDKNGKEIYEGDVLRCTYPDSVQEKGYVECVGVVTFEKEGYFSVREIGVDYIERTPAVSCEWVEDGAEIIENIHKNPELLKIKQND